MRIQMPQNKKPQRHRRQYMSPCFFNMSLLVFHLLLILSFSTEAASSILFLCGTTDGAYIKTAFCRPSSAFLSFSYCFKSKGHSLKRPSSGRSARLLRQEPFLSLDAVSSSSSDEEEASEGIRLNKVLKATHSRRQADAIIQSTPNRITINDCSIESGGRRVVPYKDVIRLDGTIVHGWEEMNGFVTPPPDDDDATTGKNVTSTKASSRKVKNEIYEYIKYWKPEGVVCTTDTSISNNIVNDLIDVRGYRPRNRFFPVGRLDKETSGLILLTSDGRLPNAVLRGQYKQPKTYHVLVNRPISDSDIQILREGIVITTIAQRDHKAKPLTAKTRPCLVSRLTSPTTHISSTSSYYSGQRCGISIVLTEGRNRQIRKMLNALHYDVVKLMRVEFMGIELYPSLQKPGDWMTLNGNEMTLIQNAILSSRE